MRSGLGNRVALALLALASAAAIGVAAPVRAAPAAAGASDCASLGQAANFAVFSNGAFNASQPSGTSVTGRIAAAGDVTLDGVSVSPPAGESTPTIVAGATSRPGEPPGAEGRERRRELRRHERRRSQLHRQRRASTRRATVLVRHRVHLVEAAERIARRPHADSRGDREPQPVFARARVDRHRGRA